MQTQRDHVNAYQFLIGRMTSALVRGDPTLAEVPARRAWFGALMGTALAILIAAGFFVYGLIVPGGNTAWQQKGAILVEEETGTRFVYTGGALRPTLNQASAMLLQGKGASVELISRNSLAGLAHGAPIGIPGAPDVVPTASSLAKGPWFLCPSSRSMTMVALKDVSAAAIPDDRYLPVSGPDGAQYLVWRNTKYRMANPSVPIALGLGTVQPVAAPAMWLNALPDGPVLGAAAIAGSGKVTIGGQQYSIGQLFRQPAMNGDEQLFVLRPDGLSPLTATEFALLEAVSVDAPVDIPASAVVSAPRSADNSLLTRLPDLTHVTLAQTGSGTVCLAQTPVGVNVVSGLVVVDATVPTPAQTGSVRAIMQPGSGMLVAALPIRAGQKVPDRYLITDLGVKYLLADDDTIEALGFSGVAPVPMANEVLSALPAGPVLSRAAVGVTERTSASGGY